MDRYSTTRGGPRVASIWGLNGGDIHIDENHRKVLSKEHQMNLDDYERKFTNDIFGGSDIMTFSSNCQKEYKLKHTVQ